MDIITSKDNQKIKNVKKIRDDAKVRKSSSLFFVEGERNICDIDSSLISEVYISDSYDGKVPSIDGDMIYRVKDNVFDDIKDTKTSQGIVALVKINANMDNDTIDKFCQHFGSSNILILDNIQDPGNLGTILRTAEASGTINIMLVNNCVDIYSPKVVRSSMSSITRLNIYRSDDAISDIKYIKDKGYDIVGTFLDGEKVYNDNIYKDKVAIVIGNEANGISIDIRNICDIKIKIPMSGKIESLNASIATAIILYEVKRQYEHIC